MSPLLDQMEKQIKSVMKRILSMQSILKNTSLPETFRIKPNNPLSENQQALLLSLDNLLVIAEELGSTIRELTRILEGDEGEQFEETWLRLQLQLFHEVTQNTLCLRLFLRGIENKAPEAEDEGNERVYWIARDAKQQDISLYLTPLNIAACFRKYLFDGKETVVFTSATLSVRNGFDYCSKQLGLDPYLLDVKILSSPFDHAAQVLLMSDKDLPDPSKTSESAYNLALSRSLEVLLEACGGGTMALFTSHKQLRAMYEALHLPLRHLGLELFADGINGGRSSLLDELRGNEKAVVFGANTFWEGVDLPGVFLTSLLIVRLPFSPPGLPLVEARMEMLESQGKDPFYEYSLPQAVLRFKQGYGRLIRSTEDWGVVVVLDNRIIYKRYGQIFQQSLPDGRLHGGPPTQLAEKIREWKKKKSAHSDAKT